MEQYWGMRPTVVEGELGVFPPSIRELLRMLGELFARRRHTARYAMSHTELRTMAQGAFPNAQLVSAPELAAPATTPRSETCVRGCQGILAESNR